MNIATRPVSHHAALHEPPISRHVGDRFDWQGLGARFAIPCAIHDPYPGESGRLSYPAGSFDMDTAHLLRTYSRQIPAVAARNRPEPDQNSTLLPVNPIVSIDSKPLRGKIPGVVGFFVPGDRGLIC